MGGEQVNTTIIGIDPGKHGAIAMVQPMTEVWELPDSPADLRYLIYNSLMLSGVDNMRVYLEKAQAMPGQGVSSMFKYGQGFGRIEGVLGALGIATRTVAPAVWKKAMGVTADKNTSRTLARQLFPEARITRSDHAEALLLAEFGRRQQG